nr:hypothetical protein [Tanacetum cinerariifolium]
MTSVPALPLVFGALSFIRADLIPPPKRVRDIGYLADVEDDPRETRVERVIHPAMLEDIPEPTQEGAAKNSDLTWWNSHKRTISVDAVYALKWTELIKLMTEVYCLRNEVEKMEIELWNLTVKGNNLTAYIQRVERFIGGLPDNIQGNVIVAIPARLQDAIRIANQLMDKKLQGYAARSAENKRRMESNPRDNRGQQPPFKRQNTTMQNGARAYTAGNNERKG